jgi:hypothetical protein
LSRDLVRTARNLARRSVRDDVPDRAPVIGLIDTANLNQSITIRDDASQSPPVPKSVTLRFGSVGIYFETSATQETSLANAAGITMRR